MQALKIDPKILREKMWKTTRQNNFSLMCSKGGERERDPKIWIDIYLVSCSKRRWQNPIL